MAKRNRIPYVTEAQPLTNCDVCDHHRSAKYQLWVRDEHEVRLCRRCAAGYASALAKILERDRRQTHQPATTNR